MSPSKSRVITLWKADFALAITLGHWSRLVDTIIIFILKGQPAAWRSETSPVWQPFGETTLGRIIQALTVPSSPAKWIEIQNTSHDVLHYDTTQTDLRFQFNAEAELNALGQTKARRTGVFR